MRFRTVAFGLLVGACGATLCFRTVQAQAPAQSGPRAQAQNIGAVRPQVYGNLAQVMRGILFPNSNVIFFAQSNNPADVKPAPDPSVSPDPLSSTYGGWTAVENSSIALAEASNLLIIPGRKCSNGRPVPLNNPDWAKFVQGLRAASMTAYQAAQSKNQDKILDAAGNISTACMNCHDRYRDKPGGIAARCM